MEVIQSLVILAVVMMLIGVGLVIASVLIFYFSRSTREERLKSAHDNLLIAFNTNLIRMNADRMTSLQREEYLMKWVVYSLDALNRVRNQEVENLRHTITDDHVSRIESAVRTTVSCTMRAIGTPALKE